jgi:hypothetical protein
VIGTKFNIIDMSQITEIETITTPDAAPVILTCFPSAKGTERLVEISGTDYRTMFGDPDFKKYGQVSIQNQRMIDAGAKLLCKRIVAPDAKLSNTTVMAIISTTTSTVTDEEGNEVQATEGVEQANGEITDSGISTQSEDGVTIAPVSETATAAVIKYVPVLYPEAKNLDEITSYFGTTKVVDGGGFVPTDNDLTDTANPYGIVLEDTQTVFAPTSDNIDADLANELGLELDATYNGFWIVNKTAVTTETTGDEGAQVTTTKFTGTSADIIGTYKAYPLFTIAEQGRGQSAKSFKIVPDNLVSKNLSFMYYTLSIIEDGNVIESARFAMLPDTLYRSECIDMNMVASTNLQFSQAHCYEDAVFAFIEDVAKISGAMDVDELQQHDFIFGTLRKGTAIDGITIDTDNGLALSENEVSVESPIKANGQFDDSPALYKSDLIALQELAFFSDDSTVLANSDYSDLTPGDFDVTDDIYDLDSYQIDAVFDANYDIKVKGKIAELANYRGDFFYFRDHGFKAEDYETIYNLIDGSYYGSDAENVIKSTYVADWVQYYDVINPYDMKQISVTITYDLSYKMISHILNSVNVPFAGKRNNATITSIVKNTLNYKPRVTPNVNEKEELEDIKCNFGTYFKDDFIIETLWTSQEDYTQLSFINNVMAVQKVIKALRVFFPSIRYQFITSTEDLQSYTTSINEFLSSYSSMFAELRFEYIQDSVAAANKIYRAALYFRFNDFAQGEQIDAYMLPTEVITG